MQEKIKIGIRNKMLRGKFAADFAASIRIRRPDNTVFFQQNLGTEESLLVAFPRQEAAGEYRVELCAEPAKNVIYATKFHYPGVGSWETKTFDPTRIIPPFTPIESRVSAQGLAVDLWGRTYQWQQQNLPSQIYSQKAGLLQEGISLELNGTVIPPVPVTVVSSEKHRVDFSASSRWENGLLEQKSWIEYDGILWNEFALTPTRDQKDLFVQIRLPATAAKYLHTSDSYAWGTKRTEKIKLGQAFLRFYPVLWLGSEDKGLCFFTESRYTWNSPVETTYRIEKDAETVTLRVHIASQLPAGETLRFQFGLIASPVRPLPADYPLNTFSYHYAAPMNRPGRAPASKFMIASNNGELGGYFGDLPSPESSINGQHMLSSVQYIHRFRGKAIPYTINRYLSDEYPEVVAFKDEWKISPDQTLDYLRDGRKQFLWDCCPTTSANAFFIFKFQQMLQRFKMDGIYFDFGLVPFCNNHAHGCYERIPLLGQREFYRRIILSQLDAGIAEPTIVLHNTDSVQLPAMTFATHLFNGEHIRQHSSTIMHGGKDILDTYDIAMFASELNSLPFGLTNSVYQANDVLIPQFGGGKEDPELYKFRITQAMMTGTLPHNTMPALTRCHFGIFDKVIRIYEDFQVPKASFRGYWINPVKMLSGSDVYVSVYRHATEARALAVVAHIGKDHQQQNVAFQINSAELNLPANLQIVDRLQAPDPEYAELAERMEKYQVSPERTPLKLGDFGSSEVKCNGNTVSLQLKAHCFALLELYP